MNGNHTNQSDVPIISGPYISPQSETSPLKRSLNRSKNLCCSNWESLDSETVNSLKTISVFLYGVTVAITFALFTQLYYNVDVKEMFGSITSDNKLCTQISLNVLKTGGNALDAAVACTMCLGVVNFHLTGLGGGGYAIIYNHKQRKTLDVIDFRESVPNSYGDQTIEISIPGYTVGVPGFLMGLYESHRLYGKLPWSDLVMPSVLLARNGFTVPDSVVDSLRYFNEAFENSTLGELFKSLTHGETLTFPHLAAALELIASKGATVFYKGSLGSKIIDSVKEAQGAMTMDDLAGYKVVHTQPVETMFGGFKIITTDSSSGGVLLANSLDSLQTLDLLPVEDGTPATLLKLTEVLQSSYTSYLRKSGSVPNIPAPASAHVSVVDSDELYVTFVTSLNTWLGSQILTEAGFLLNNGISNGGIDPNRRPVSMASPVIAVQDGEICGRRLVLGGGDATLVAQVLLNLLIYNKTVVDSIESPRFTLDDFPHKIKIEVDHKPLFNNQTIDKLKNLKTVVENLSGPYSSINIIEKISDNITCYSDTRGGGSSVHFGPE